MIKRKSKERKGLPFRTPDMKNVPSVENLLIVFYLSHFTVHILFIDFLRSGHLFLNR